MSQSSMPWVKLFTEMLDDPKLGRVSERARWRFVQLLMMAGECDAEGYLVNGDQPMSTDDIAWRLRLEPAKLASDLAALENISVIANTDKGWRVIKFAARQGRNQSEVREKWRQSKAQQRARSAGPTWEPQETPEELTPVLEDTEDSPPVRPTPRVEESREEKKVEDKTTVPEPLSGLTPAAEFYFQTFKRKRWANAAQAEFFAKLETEVSPDVLTRAVRWAAEKGVSDLHAIRSTAKKMATGPKTNGGKPAAGAGPWGARPSTNGGGKPTGGATQ